MKNCHHFTEDLVKFLIEEEGVVNKYIDYRYPGYEIFNDLSAISNTQWEYGEESVSV